MAAVISLAHLTLMPAHLILAAAEILGLPRILLRRTLPPPTSRPRVSRPISPTDLKTRSRILHPISPADIILWPRVSGTFIILPHRMSEASVISAAAFTISWVVHITGILHFAAIISAALGIGTEGFVIFTADGGMRSLGGSGATATTITGLTFVLPGGGITLMDITDACAITVSIEGGHQAKSVRPRPSSQARGRGLADVSVRSRINWTARVRRRNVRTYPGVKIDAC